MSKYTIEITRVGTKEYGYRVYCYGKLENQSMFQQSVAEAEKQAMDWVNAQTPGESSDIIKSIHIEHEDHDSDSVVEEEY